MKFKDDYSKLLNDLYQKYNVQELNSKIQNLNELFDKDRKDFIIPMPEFVFLKKGANHPKNGREHGEIKEIIKKTVKNMGIVRITKINVHDALLKNGHEVRMGTIAGTLKRWAKEKDPNGIKRTKKGKGSHTTIYKNLGIVEK